MPAARKNKSPKTSSLPKADEEKDASPRAAVSSTVAKAVGIVDILVSKADNGISLAELSALIGMPKSSTHRYLATLTELGLAERTGVDRFRLGTKVIELAGSYLASSDLRNESQAILSELAEQSGETTHLAVPSGTDVVYISKVESKHAWGMFSHIGARLPMHCTALGKAILAFSSDGLVQKVFAEPPKPRTPHTITSIQAFEEEMARIRTQGFSMDDEENEIGIRCIGAPVIDFTGQAVAAISISGPITRMDHERCAQLSPLVREAALMISKRRGHV